MTVTEFLEGETYAHPKYDRDIFVLGIGAETSESVTLAILWVDRESKESTSGDELVVKKSEISEWQLSEF